MTAAAAIPAVPARFGGGGSAAPGATLRARRCALGLSQLTLAIHAGLGERTVLRVEAGARCTAFTLRSIADALDELEAAA